MDGEEDYDEDFEEERSFDLSNARRRSGRRGGKGDDPRQRPRRNLPPACEYDGNVEDPKIFKRYKALVENWVLIAKTIIGPESGSKIVRGAERQGC